MESLYIIEPGSYLRKDGDCLNIMQDKQLLQSIPAKGLQRLTLVGRSSFSGAVIDFLINNKIDTVFLTPTGRFRGRLLLDEAGHVTRRRNQYVHLAKPEFALKTAQIIVTGKLCNQYHHIRERAKRDKIKQLSTTALQLRAIISQLKKSADLETIRGYEGYGSRLYFSVFGLLIKNDTFTFTGRNRRPPRDPVNALLSFVYTMLTNEVTSAVNSTGLDPYLGALHEPAPGRPSLSCDLVEEWRVFGDRLVLGLINRKVISMDDFIMNSGEPDKPVRMKPAVSKALIRSYERQMQTKVTSQITGEKTKLRWLLHRQTRQFNHWLTDQKRTYIPFAG